MAVAFPMSALDILLRYWPWIAAMAAGWAGIALHTGLSMRRYGRRWWVWFIISLLFSAIPAVIVSHVEYYRQLGRTGRGSDESPLRCPHCRGELTRADMLSAGGSDVCPNCKMIIEDQHYA